MSFYEIREVVEDVRPCSNQDLSQSKDAVSKVATNSKDSKENLDVSQAGGANQGETWVEVEINDFDQNLQTESNQATHRPNETPTTSITTATSGEKCSISHFKLILSSKF